MHARCLDALSAGAGFDNIPHALGKQNKIGYGADITIVVYQQDFGLRNVFRNTAEQEFEHLFLFWD
jgi:hypothetical protein